MSTKLLKYTRRQTINMGEFTSVVPEWGEEYELKPGDNVKDAYRKLVKRVDKLWLERARAMIKSVLDMREGNERDEQTSDIMAEIIDAFWLEDDPKKPKV